MSLQTQHLTKILHEILGPLSEKMHRAISQLYELSAIWRRFTDSLTRETLSNVFLTISLVAAIFRTEVPQHQRVCPVKLHLADSWIELFGRGKETFSSICRSTTDGKLLHNRFVCGHAQLGYCLSLSSANQLLNKQPKETCATRITKCCTSIGHNHRSLTPPTSPSFLHLIFFYCFSSTGRLLLMLRWHVNLYAANMSWPLGTEVSFQKHFMRSAVEKRKTAFVLSG